jgi:hypothetical protein
LERVCGVAAGGGAGEEVAEGVEGLGEVGVDEAREDAVDLCDLAGVEVGGRLGEDEGEAVEEVGHPGDPAAVQLLLEGVLARGGVDEGGELLDAAGPVGAALEEAREGLLEAFELVGLGVEVEGGADFGGGGVGELCEEGLEGGAVFEGPELSLREERGEPAGHDLDAVGAVGLEGAGDGVGGERGGPGERVGVVGGGEDVLCAARGAVVGEDRGAASAEVVGAVEGVAEGGADGVGVVGVVEGEAGAARLCALDAEGLVVGDLGLGEEEGGDAGQEELVEGVVARGGDGGVAGGEVARRRRSR